MHLELYYLENDLKSFKGRVLGRTLPFIFPEIAMRYHYEKPAIYSSKYGATYTCNHPVYNKCTLYLIDGKGLAVIQQRCDDEKRTWWDEIDPWLTNELYLHPRFKKFFDTRAGKHDEGLYPTVTIRQIMWALRMKPLKRERWETCFDKKIFSFAMKTFSFMRK